MVNISPRTSNQIFNITNRDAPRPAVAPFSAASEPNGMVDDRFNKPLEEIGYPPETSEEEDEVMMDFVSGR